MAFTDTWSKLVGFVHFYGVGTVYTVKQFFWKTDKDVKRPKNFTLGQENEGSFPLALITGGTKGLGLELAKLLIRERFAVILVARNKTDGENAVETLKSIDPQCPPVDFYSVDLSDLDQMKKFLDEVVIKKYKKLHLLVNNAGLMMTPYTLVQKGRFELQWATNLVATVFLTESLLPLLKNGAREDGLGRVINLSSSGMFSHNLTESYLKNMPCTEEHYSSHFAYSNSKFAIALYTFDLQHRIDEEKQVQKVTAYSLHPGIISTDLFQHLSAPIRGFFAVSKVFYRSAADAACDMLYLCLHDQADLIPGHYYENMLERPIAQVDLKTREAFKEYIEHLRKSF